MDGLSGVRVEFAESRGPSARQPGLVCRSHPEFGVSSGAEGAAQRTEGLLRSTTLYAWLMPIYSRVMNELGYHITHNLYGLTTVFRMMPRHL